MFKKFKDKLAEEMKQSPARLQASMQQFAQAVSPAMSNSSIQDISATNDNFSLTEEGDETPKNSPAKHGFQSVDLTPPSLNSQGVSRKSSVSSITSTSDASSLFPIYESPDNMYHLQSDMDQSASEADDNISAQLDRVSKDQLYSAYRKVQTRYHKYRGRYTDLANHYREMERAKNKLETLLVETREKALGKISNLKEQSQLEQQAKAHLEDAFRNDIEEKNHIIDTLNTKVRLLQANGLVSLQNQPDDSKDDPNCKTEMLIDISTEPQDSNQESSSQALIAENEQLKTKLETMESILLKYKESLKKNKDKISEITQDKSIIERDFDIYRSQTSQDIKNIEDNLKTARDEISNLNNQISAMKKTEEESVISLAENKWSIHRELEEKEEEIKKLNLELQTLNVTKDSLTIELEKLKLIDSEKIQKMYQDELEKNQNYQNKIDQLEKEILCMKIVEEELVKTKNSLEKKINEIEEKEKNQISDELKIKNQQIEELNSKIQAYTAAILKAKEKIETQNNQIKILNDKELNVNENSEKLLDEIDSKKVELLGLESELKSCRSTINDLREKLKENGINIDQLKREKICLIANIIDYKKTINSFKVSCEEIKSQVVNYKDKQSDEILTLTKLFEEHLSNIKDTEKLENIEKEKLNIIEEKNKLTDIDIEKLQEELSSTKIELKKTKEDLNNYKIQNETTSEKIQQLEQLKEKCEKYAMELNESLKQSDDLQLENSELKKNYEELMNLKVECENYSKLFEENLKKTKILEAENKDLTLNWQEASKSIEAFKLEILEYQSVIETKSEELKTLEVENETLQKKTEISEESVINLRSEILKQNTLIEEKNTGLLSWEQKFNEQNEELTQIKLQIENHTKLLEESLEKSRDLAAECKRLTDENIQDGVDQEKLKNELDNQKIAFENNIQELENKLSSKDDEISKILEDNRSSQNNNEAIEIKLKNVEEKYSKLETEKLLLVETLEAKNQMIEKLNILKNKQTKAIQDINAKLQDSENKNTLLKNIETSAKTHEESAKNYLIKLEQVTAENENLVKVNKELENIQEKSIELEEKLSQLLSENLILKDQIKTLSEESLILENQRKENVILKTKLNEIEIEKENAQVQLKELKESNNQLLKSEEEYQSRIFDMEQLSNKHLAEIEELKNNVQSLENRIKSLQADFNNKYDRKNKELNELLEKEAWTTQVIEELKKHSETLEAQLDDRKNQLTDNKNNSISSEEEDRLRKLIQEIQAQLQDRETKLITSQAKESQMEILNEEIKKETNSLKDQIKTVETEQGMRMQQLVKEFQAQLHDKDEQLQAALNKKFDRQQNYESDLVQQYKEQLKDFQVELTAKSEEIESLKREQSEDTMREIEKLVATIANIKDSHAAELRDIEKKWQAIIQQKISQLEAKHDDNIKELTKEWQNDKLTDEKLDQKSEELENMSRVAMAAVQSNTGSFHSLQQTVMSQRRELTELRKIIKLRHDTLEDSTEIEYLRNILYEYMMGRETLVLARVIAAVVKFDQDQTNKILKKEEDKLTLLGSLRLA